MALFDFLTSTKRPPVGTAVLSADDVRKRLLSVNRPTAPYRVIDGASEDVDVIAEWKIVDASWNEIFAKAGLTKTFNIFMKLHPALFFSHSAGYLVRFLLAGGAFIAIGRLFI